PKETPMTKTQLESIVVAIVFGLLGLALLATIPGWLQSSFIYSLLFPIILLVSGIHLLLNSRSPINQTKLGLGLTILGALALLVEFNWINSQTVIWLAGVSLTILSVFMLSPYLKTAPSTQVASKPDQ